MSSSDEKSNLEILIHFPAAFLAAEVILSLQERVQLLLDKPFKPAESYYSPAVMELYSVFLQKQKIMHGGLSLGITRIITFDISFSRIKEKGDNSILELKKRKNKIAGKKQVIL